MYNVEKWLEDRKILKYARPFFNIIHTRVTQASVNDLIYSIVFEYSTANLYNDGEH